MEVEEKIESFIKSTLKSAGKAFAVERNAPLLTSQVLDSLFVIDLILFLEKEFKLDLSKDSITALDIDTIADMENLVKRKLASM